MRHLSGVARTVVTVILIARLERIIIDAGAIVINYRVALTMCMRTYTYILIPCWGRTPCVNNYCAQSVNRVEVHNVSFIRLTGNIT